ncbi:TAT-binding protein-like protein 7, AAA ATPase [Coemansia sp. RSA 1972]|nr:TAT-binding protein-like protein 7, AAA ATPase [Coemansia sp. RSA 1972]
MGRRKSTRPTADVKPQLNSSPGYNATPKRKRQRTEVDSPVSTPSSDSWRPTLRTRSSPQTGSDRARPSLHLGANQARLTPHVGSGRASTPELKELLGSSQPPSDDNATDDAYASSSSSAESSSGESSSSEESSDESSESEEEEKPAAKAKNNGSTKTATAVRASPQNRVKAEVTQVDECQYIPNSRTRRQVLPPKQPPPSIKPKASRISKPPASPSINTRTRASPSISTRASPSISTRASPGVDSQSSQYNLRQRQSTVSYKEPAPPLPPSSGQKQYAQALSALEREAAEFNAINELEDAISQAGGDVAREGDGRGENLTGNDDMEPILPINLGELGAERCRRAGCTDAAKLAGPKLTVPPISFADVGGLDDYIRSLKEMVELPLVYPEIYGAFGMKPPRGVLFHGPPGTGKTLMARALSQSCSAHSSGQPIAFFMRRGADCLSKYVGEAERQLRRLFEQARRFEPSIIFFDELDGLAPVRSSRQDQVHSSIVATLLALMDGIDDRGQVVVIGATNRPDSIDPALRRPGRFDREMLFRLPGPEARRRILQIHTRRWQRTLATDVEDEVVDRTQGWGGADIGALCTESVLAAIRRSYPQIYSSTQKLAIDPRRIAVTRSDVLHSVEAMAPSTQRSGASGTAALHRALRPLLGRHEARAVTQLSAALALRTDSVRSMANAQMPVFRPRVAVYGLSGMGVQAVGAAAAHQLEALDVPVFVLSALAMHQDAGTPPGTIIARVFGEARRRQPSIVFVPAASQLLDVVGASTVAFLTQCIQALPMNERVAVLVTAEAPVAHVASVVTASADRTEALDIAHMTHAERVWRAAMPAFARAWFGGAPNVCRVCVSSSTSSQRAAFFAPIIESADAVGRPPQMPQMPDMRDFEVLHVSSVKTERVADTVHAADTNPNVPNAETERAAVRQLQKGLQSVVDVLVSNKLFRRFVSPPTARQDHGYFKAISEPMFLAMVAIKVRAGKYATAQQFLDDIALIARNALTYARTPGRGAARTGSGTQDSDSDSGDESESEDEESSEEESGEESESEDDSESEDKDVGVKSRVDESKDKPEDKDVRVKSRIDETTRYAEMLQSAAARLVDRHIGTQTVSNDPISKEAEPPAEVTGTYAQSDNTYTQSASTYEPMTPTSGGSDTTLEVDPQPRTPAFRRVPASNHGIPQVVAHTLASPKRSVSDVRKQLVSDLAKLSSGFSTEDLESLRVRLAAVVGGSKCSTPRAAFKELSSALKAWHTEALRDCSHEGLLDDGFCSDEQ